MALDISEGIEPGNVYIRVLTTNEVSRPCHQLSVLAGSTAQASSFMLK